MTRKELEQVYYIEREIKLLKEEISEELEKSSIRGIVLSCVPKGAGKSDNTAKTAVKKVTYVEELKKLCEKCQQAKAEVMEYIAGVEDSIIRQILILKCIKCLGWTKIAVEIGGDNSIDGVKKLYYRFLKNNLSE